MNNYIAELKYMSNENYELPSHLEEFKMSAKNMDAAINVFRNKLSIHMSDKEDYYIESGFDYENHSEISFSDVETGQDVCYSISIA